MQKRIHVGSLIWLSLEIASYGDKAWDSWFQVRVKIMSLSPALGSILGVESALQEKKKKREGQLCQGEV